MILFRTIYGCSGGHMTARRSAKRDSAQP